MLRQNYTLDTLDFIQRHEWGNGKEGEGFISVTVFSKNSLLFRNRNPNEKRLSFKTHGRHCFFILAKQDNGTIEKISVL